MSNQERYIHFDWAIKDLLRQKANFRILEGFLTVLIGEEIYVIDILESEGNQERQVNKLNSIDIKARDSKDNIIIVKIQNIRKIHYLERILYGIEENGCKHILLDKSYEKVEKVYSISILYFDVGYGTDYLYHGQNGSFIAVHTQDVLQMTTKARNAIIPKMPEAKSSEHFLIRLNEFNKVATTPLEEWIQYLKTGTIEKDTHVSGLEEACIKLKYYNMSPKDRYAYDEHINAVMIQNDVLETARLEGLQEGLEESQVKKRYEEKRKIAQRMKSRSYSLKDIMDVTSLTSEEIEKL